MLKFVVLISISIIGSYAKCSSRETVKCAKKYKINQRMSSDEICRMLKANNKCLSSFGCDMTAGKEMYNKICGPGTNCDIKQALICEIDLEPLVEASYHLLQVSVSDLKQCLINAQCKKSANLLGNEFCLED